MKPGEYQVRVGMYTWPDLERQEITQDGAYVGDSLLAGQFTVQ